MKNRDASQGGSERTTITLSISKADKMRVKLYATRERTTVSELLHRWIEEHCD